MVKTETANSPCVDKDAQDRFIHHRPSRHWQWTAHILRIHKQAVSGQPGSKVACNHHDVTPSVQQYPVHQHIIGIMAPETPPCASWAQHHPPAEVKRTEWTHILPSAKAEPDSARGWISATSHLSNWLRRIWFLRAALYATYKPLKWLDCRQKLYNI